MKFTDKEKEQMTSFLNEFLENNNLLTSQVDFFVQKYNCQYDEAEYLIRTICEINESDLDIFVAERFNDGSYAIVSIDNYKCRKFINQGGFITYFADKTKKVTQDNDLTMLRSGKMQREEYENKMKPNSGKIFISHATKDHEVASKFCDLILGNVLNIPVHDIFNTSHEGTKPITGENFRSRIKNEILNAKVVLQFISTAYKASEACLIEMGAAWVLSNNVKPLIVQKGSYEVGFIHSTTQQAQLHNEEHLVKLIDELKDEGVFQGEVKSAVVLKKIKEFTNWLNEYDVKDTNSIDKSFLQKSDKEVVRKISRKISPTEGDLAIITNYLDSKKYTKITFEGVRKHIHPKFTEKYILALIEKFPNGITRTKIKGESAIQNLYPDFEF